MRYNVSEILEEASLLLDLRFNKLKLDDKKKQNYFIYYLSDFVRSGDAPNNFVFPGIQS